MANSSTAQPDASSQDVDRWPGAAVDAIAATQAMLAPVLTDSHAHLGYVRDRLGQAHVDSLLEGWSRSTTNALILDPGVEFDDFPQRRAAFGTWPCVRLAAGIWPDSASMHQVTERVTVLEQYVRGVDCVAVGECGLDYHWMSGSPAQQAALFGAQLELAIACGKPLIVHSRDAFADTLSIVASVAGRIPVLIHCFGYGPAEAEAFIKAGCWLSFAGNVTYRKADALRQACRLVPDDRLLLETDAPYMNPEPRRGRDASPLDIGRTYALVADLRRLDGPAGVATLAALVTRNATGLFGTALAAVPATPV
jgi:TatD DNase family protein